MAGNWLDNAIDFVSPKLGAKRLALRHASAEMQAAYQGAYPTRVSTQWGPSESLSGMPHLHMVAARSMRDRARSFVENYPIASSLLDRATENVIGPGYRLQVSSADTTWNAKAESLMHNWFASADYYGYSWIQHQRLICNSFLRDGDVGAALLSRGQVQLVEGDYISSPPRSSEAFFHDGVELDATGRVARYHVMTFVDQKKRDWRPVAPKDFIFLANRRRVTQYRGETKFAQFFDLFDSVKGYIDAVVLAQKIAACLSIFITKQSPTTAVQGLRTGMNAQGQQQKKMLIEPGMVQVLQEGETIQQVNPAQPGNGFDVNLRMLIRMLCLSFGMPIEYGLLDFSGVSGQTAKASSLMAQRSFETIQKLLIDEYYSRLYRWRISKFIKDGELEPRDDSFKHSWHPEPWPYLDPVKEIQALQLEVDAGLNTEKRIATARGMNYERLLTERADELAKKRAGKIPIYHTSMAIEVGTKDKPSNEESDATAVAGQPATPQTGAPANA